MGVRGAGGGGGGGGADMKLKVSFTSHRVLHRVTLKLINQSHLLFLGLTNSLPVRSLPTLSQQTKGIHLH